MSRLVQALWLGSGAFLILAAQAAFRAAPNATVAADVVGAMLMRWHYIALAAPLALFVLELRRLRSARAFVLGVLFAAVLLAALQALVDVRIRAVRTEALIPVSSLPREHPTRRKFGRLHGISMMLLAAQVVAATVVVLRRDVVPALASHDDPATYKVVVNGEGARSIWPVGRENVEGWSDAGFQGTKSDCITYVQRT